MVTLNDRIFYKSATLYFPNKDKDESWFQKRKDFDGRYLNLKAKVGEEEMLVNTEISYPIIKQVLWLIEKNTLEEKLLKPIMGDLLDDISDAEKQVLDIHELSKTKVDFSYPHSKRIEWAQDGRHYSNSYKVYDNFIGRDYNGRSIIGKIVDLKAEKVFNHAPDYLKNLADSERFGVLKNIDVGIEEEGCGRGFKSSFRSTNKGRAYVSGSSLKDALEKYLLCYKESVK